MGSLDHMRLKVMTETTLSLYQDGAGRPQELRSQISFMESFQLKLFIPISRGSTSVLIVFGGDGNSQVNICQQIIRNLTKSPELFNKLRCVLGL